jgi:hypothetical protein
VYRKYLGMNGELFLSKIKIMTHAGHFDRSVMTRRVHMGESNLAMSTVQPDKACCQNDITDEIE